MDRPAAASSWRPRPGGAATALLFSGYSPDICLRHPAFLLPKDLCILLLPPSTIYSTSTNLDAIPFLGFSFCLSHAASPPPLSSLEIGLPSLQHKMDKIVAFFPDGHPRCHRLHAADPFAYGPRAVKRGAAPRLLSFHARRLCSHACKWEFWLPFPLDIVYLGYQLTAFFLLAVHTCSSSVIVRIFLGGQFCSKEIVPES